MLEAVAAGIWNGYRAWRAHTKLGAKYPGDLELGRSVPVAYGPSRPVRIWARDRTKHVTVLGKSGMGKTTLLMQMAKQDIASGNGFVFLDLHGQVTPQLTALLASRTGAHGRAPVVIVDPTDRDQSVGINVLDANDQQDAHVKVADIVSTLRARWHLDAFGARTEELLRNALILLIELKLTLLEVEPLLTDSAFRHSCVARSLPSSATAYFTDRFERLSPQMRAVVVEPVINKLTAFTADPHIRHIVGQADSTVDFALLLDRGAHVIVNLDKGKLGAHAATLGSLLLLQIRQALFSRLRKKVFTLYCDEIQNLVVFDQGLEDLLAEARKFGVSIVSANQFLDQLTPRMRASLTSTSTLVCFQLSGLDALRIAHAAGMGPPIVDRLRSLPERQFMISDASRRFLEVRTRDLLGPKPAIEAQIRAIRQTGSLPREVVEAAIRARRGVAERELHDWT